MIVTQAVTSLLKALMKVIIIGFGSCICFVDGLVLFSDEKDRASSRRKAPKRKPSRHQRPSEDGGEDTDEGEVESREVDYFTDTSSESEEERVGEKEGRREQDDRVVVMG